jgi:hypothetical protein
VKKPIVALFSTLAALVPLAGATTILVDFGSTATTGDVYTWNSVTSFGVGQKFANLRDSSNTLTGYGLSISQSAFAGSNSESNTTFTPASAYGNSFYGAYESVQNLASTISLSGLDPSVTYTFSFFSSILRTGTRGTRFTINGTSAEIEPVNNASTWTAPITATPDAFGNLNVVIDRASFNTNQSYVVNVMKIEYTIPEPATAALSALGVFALLKRRRA